jgi:hypothetical protein
VNAVRVYYLVKSRAITLNFRDGQHRTFSPSALVPEQFTENLLTKMISIGGCCGKPTRTMHLFATEEQLQAGEREWIE